MDFPQKCMGSVWISGFFVWISKKSVWGVSRRYVDYLENPYTFKKIYNIALFKPKIQKNSDVNKNTIILYF